MPNQNLEFIGSMYCEQYQCRAEFYLEPSHTGEPRPATGTGARHLIVRYGDGYTGPGDRPLVEGGQREFAIGVPDALTKEQLLDFLTRPPQAGSFPKWEAPTRGYGLNILK
jgi:hypothetical protein